LGSTGAHLYGIGDELLVHIVQLRGKLGLPPPQLGQRCPLRTRIRSATPCALYTHTRALARWRATLNSCCARLVCSEMAMMLSPNEDNDDVINTTTSARHGPGSPRQPRVQRAHATRLVWTLLQ
jgi:hypothetical protein